MYGKFEKRVKTFTKEKQAERKRETFFVEYIYTRFENSRFSIYPISRLTFQISTNRFRSFPFFYFGVL